MIFFYFHKLSRKFWYLFNSRRYKHINKSNIIIKPILITPEYITMGVNSYIRNNARIEGVRSRNGILYNPSIEIGKNVGIEQNLHLTCCNRIVIGDYTSISANVTITDIIHPYDDINIPIDRQKLIIKDVYIGESCKIYNNVVILPGIHIGNHVCIGANSVVTNNIPSFCVAVGNPARIIKRYNFSVKKWQRTDTNGNYI